MPAGWGLSPRLRGNPEYRRAAAPCPGSIPALTGKPQRRLRAERRGEVYPRAYGETQHGAGRVRHQSGLSPRLRGNPAWCGSSTTPVGSIPALTGKPLGQFHVVPPGTVYPRAYGETAFFLIAGNRSLGLSPRLRGNLCEVRSMADDLRSIPALTGKPLLVVKLDRLTRVYPRAYGETAWAVSVLLVDGGLSPRLRGNPPPPPPPGARSIPALTGKPAPDSASPAAARVYPRAYGETGLRYHKC